LYVYGIPYGMIPLPRPGDKKTKKKIAEVINVLLGQANKVSWAQPRKIC
jgi:hypothetical protein